MSLTTEGVTASVAELSDICKVDINAMNRAITSQSEFPLRFVEGDICTHLRKDGS